MKKYQIIFPVRIERREYVSLEICVSEVRKMLNLDWSHVGRNHSSTTVRIETDNPLPFFFHLGIAVGARLGDYLSAESISESFLVAEKNGESTSGKSGGAF